MSQRTPLIIANWKMNKLVHETPDFVEKLANKLGEIPSGAKYEVVIAPPATHLMTLAQAAPQKGFKVGAQNCGQAKFGAFTGETSPVVLKELHCEWVILGHSERRHVYKETDALILSRMKAALEEGLEVVFCVGEVLQDRKAGNTFKTVETQLSVLKDLPAASLSKVTVAYEPVWAIGTGENATPNQAQEVHAFIRGWVSKNVPAMNASTLRILYGGSVKPENALELMAQKDVDGLLVGGASLDPVAFAGIISNGVKSRN